MTFAHSREWVSGVAVLVLALTACSSERPAAAPALAMPDPDSVSTWGFTPVEGEVLLVGGTPLDVLRPVTLEKVELATESGEVELLAARVSLFACRECRPRSDVVGFAGHAGSSCTTGEWPPSGYGPSYPVAGFEVAPGDRPSILVYLRPRSATARTGGITVTYRERDGSTGASVLTNERIEISPPRDADGDRCNGSMWFGSPDPLSHLVKPLSSPTPSATRSPVALGAIA